MLDDTHSCFDVSINTVSETGRDVFQSQRIKIQSGLFAPTSLIRFNSIVVFMKEVEKIC